MSYDIFPLFGIRPCRVACVSASSALYVPKLLLNESQPLSHCRIVIYAIPCAVEPGYSTMAPADSAGVEDAQQVETLVAGRKKRLTAGNRMGVVMNVEGDDELTLLCASVGEGNEGEDQEYDGIEKGGSEADTGDSMSSSDDDGAFAETARDDLSGEKELQRSEKIDKAKQRRRLDRWSKRPRDRGTRSTKSNKVNDRAGTVEILHEDSAPNCAQAENATVGPPRSSLRKHTVQIRHETNRRAQETRERQKHQAEAQEATAKHRSTSKPKLMTQSERLSEAARVELHNSQSLNRWETAEAKRREDQRARFAALRDRRLDGPVITFLSSPAIWAGGHVVASGAQGVNNHWQRQCDQSGCFAPRCDQGDVPTSCGSHNCQYTMTYETAISATRDGVFTHTNHSAFSDPTRYGPLPEDNLPTASFLPFNVADKR